MIILDNNNSAVILDSIHVPVLAEYFWVLDLNMYDYTLAPLLILEEVITPSIELQIGNFRFSLPANWNMLVADDDTSQLDVVEIAELAGREFKALVYGPNMSMATLETVVVTDYHPHFKNVGPSLNKHQMLCHPISPYGWISVAPTDSYNKYLKELTIGDLI